MGYWTNDLNNWQQRWSITDEDIASPAVCLLAKSHSLGPVPEGDKDGEFAWLNGNVEEVVPNRPVDIQARLWSPKLPAKIGMKCLTLIYSLHLGEGEQRVENFTLASLSILQRQEGCLCI